MSDKKKYNLNIHLENAEKLVKEFVIERDQLNNKLKNYILSLQSINSDIYRLLFSARAYYKEKHYECNIKLAKLKSQKIESERFWNHLTRKISTLQKPRIDANISISIENTRLSIEDIEYKINILNKKLEEQLLGIAEENEIIEELIELRETKQKEINKLTELEQRQVKKFQTSDYYKTQIRIETLEKNLKEVYENLIELSNKRLYTHKKILGLYKKVKKFEKIKKNIETELIKDKITADNYHQLFLKLMNINQKELLNKISNEVKSRVRPKEIKTTHEKVIIKRKKKFKRFEQKKLAIALDKQKSGKKLNFYEYQLILKHSKNKRES